MYQILQYDNLLSQLLLHITSQTLNNLFADNFFTATYFKKK